jgi:hypothetical protein
MYVTLQPWSSSISWLQSDSIWDWLQTKYHPSKHILEFSAIFYVDTGLECVQGQPFLKTSDFDQQFSHSRGHNSNKVVSFGRFYCILDLWLYACNFDYLSADAVPANSSNLPTCHGRVCPSDESITSIRACLHNKTLYFWPSFWKKFVSNNKISQKKNLNKCNTYVFIVKLCAKEKDPSVKNYIFQEGGLAQGEVKTGH